MRIQRLQVAAKIEEGIIKPINISDLDPILETYKGKKGSLIPILQHTQELWGYIPEEAFTKISAETGYKLADMYGVATFYAQFRLKPVGKYVVKVCHGTACHVQNAKMVTDALKDTLKVEDGGTTPDGLFTLESVACLGCCSLAPVMMIGENTYGKLDEKAVKKVIREIRGSEL